MEVDSIRTRCTETLIVSLLTERPMHGYEMGKEVERRSQGYFSFKHSTLYPLLHKLEKRGLVVGSWEGLDGGKPRKHYELTEAGRSYHTSNAAQWREFFLAMVSLIPEVAP